MCQSRNLSPPYHLGIAHQALRDQFRMLDKIGGGVEHSRNEHLIVGQFDIAKDGPLMFVARIGPFQRNGLWPGFEHNAQNVFEGNITMVGAFIVAPAQVEPHAVWRQITQGMIEGFNIRFSNFEKFAGAEIRKGEMPSHGQIRTIHL